MSKLCFTKNNHFKFGYNGKWFVDRIDKNQKFTVEFGKCEHPPLDWRQESILAAQAIANSTDLPISILYSGGVDSEVTIMSFMAAKIPFTAQIMRFNDDINYHDIRYALDFCNKHDLKYNVHDIDIIKFFEGEMYDYAAATHCLSPQLCATMWLVDQVDGFPVIGQGECVIILDGDRWKFRESEMVNSFYRHYLVNNKEGVPGFHQYTPEQMLSFLMDDTFLPYMNTESGKTSNKTTKLKIYQKYFPLETRPKFTGFENIMDHDKKHRNCLAKLYSDWNDIAAFDYEKIIEILSPSTL